MQCHGMVVIDVCMQKIAHGLQLALVDCNRNRKFVGRVMAHIRHLITTPHLLLRELQHVGMCDACTLGAHQSPEMLSRV